MDARNDRLMGRALTVSWCLFTMLKVSVGQVSPDNLILTKAAMAIFGSWAIEGVLILSAKNRRICKEFERIELD